MLNSSQQSKFKIDFNLSQKPIYADIPYVKINPEQRDEGKAIGEVEKSEKIIINNPLTPTTGTDDISLIEKTLGGEFEIPEKNCICLNAVKSQDGDHFRLRKDFGVVLQHGKGRASTISLSQGMRGG
jgi:hypothetical protein